MYEHFLNMESHTDGIQEKALCPFHDDTNPSFFADPDDQWWCFGCGEGGGPVTFLQRYLGISKSTAQYSYDYYKQHDQFPFPAEETVEEYHQILLNEPELISYFHQMEVGVDLLKEYKIGWDMQSKRIVFPIPSRLRSDFYINLRKYRPAGSGQRTSKLINLSKLGDSIYYPYSAFDEQEIYIVEGEKDMLVGRALGLNTITGTGGSTIPKVDAQLFKDKKVHLMVDNDSAGDLIAREYYSKLKKFASEINRIKLPNKDISDVVVKNKNINVLDYATDMEEALEADKIEEISIGEMFDPKNENQVFRVNNLRIIGEDMTSYQVPQSVDLSDGETAELSPRELLSFIGTPDGKIKQHILMGRGEDVVIENRNDVVAQQVYFRPDINVYENEIDQSTHSNLAGIYLSQDGTPIKTNRVYHMEMMKTTHPRTQENIFVITRANEAIMDAEVNLMDLEYFRSDQSVENLMQQYYDIWAPHLEVNGRSDLFEAMVLSYLSVLEFKWRNSKIKGRLDTIVIGDTRTGKTKMIRNFMNTLKIGEYVSGENAKATGIIGGINNIKNTWTLNWGKIPINDKRLVVIDEASGLSIGDITDLSQMRSEGILSITKIKQESTYARTRLLWITNPRSGKKISEYYWNGYGALKEFLPVQEDLARYDLAISASIDDVDNIFDYPDTDMMEEVDIDRWRNLILFAWNLKSEEITFTKQARQDIMDKSIKLGNRFNNEPLFMSVNGYEKLARIAIASAVLTFNFIDKQIVVEERHVEYAVNLLLRAYTKKSFGLSSKADEDRRMETLTEETTKHLEKLYVIYSNLDNLFRDGVIAHNMVPTILGVDREGADRLISELYNLGLVELGENTNTIKPTPSYLEYIREERKKND